MVTSLKSARNPYGKYIENIQNNANSRSLLRFLTIETIQITYNPKAIIIRQESTFFRFISSVNIKDPEVCKKNLALSKIFIFVEVGRPLREAGEKKNETKKVIPIRETNINFFSTGLLTNNIIKAIKGNKFVPDLAEKESTDKAKTLNPTINLFLNINNEDRNKRLKDGKEIMGSYAS